VNTGSSDREIVSGTPKKIGNINSDTMPTNQEGVCIPVVQGRGRLGITWADGALDPQAYEVSVKVGKSTETTGYKYYADVGGLVCMGPVTRIMTMWAEDDIIWEGDLSIPDDGYVDLQTDIGSARFRFGTGTQTQDGYIFDVDAHPAYRWQAMLEFQQQYFGRDTTNARAVEIEVERFPDVPESIQSINGSANPVGALYEVLTNSIWGAGLSTDLFDFDSFETVGAILKEDGLGMSYVWTQDSDATDVVDTIMSSFKGSLVWQADTQEYKLVQGYRAPETTGLLEISAAECSSLPKVKMTAWSATPGEVRLDYTDRDRSYKESQMLFASNASLIVNGRRDTISVSRLEIDTQTTALTVGSQIKTEITYPTAEGSFEAMARTVADLREGDYFKLELWPDAPDFTVCRCTRRSDGGAMSRDVSIDFVVDVNTWANSGGSGGTAYTRPDPATYEPVSHIYQAVVESPRFISGNAVETLLLVGRAHTLIIGYGHYAKFYASPSYHNCNIVSSDYSYFGLPVEIAVAPGDGADIELNILNDDSQLFESVDTDQQGAGELLLFVGDEIISLASLVYGETLVCSNVLRGFGDTKLTDHDIGTAGIVVYSAKIPAIDLSPLEDLLHSIKLPAQTLVDEQDLDDITSLSITGIYRHYAPLNIFGLSIGGEAIAKPSHHYSLADAELSRSFDWGESMVFDCTRVSWGDIGFSNVDFYNADDITVAIELTDDEGTVLDSASAVADEITLTAPDLREHIYAVIKTQSTIPNTNTTISSRHVLNVGIALNPPTGSAVDAEGTFAIDDDDDYGIDADG
jgi:hypothetical protein